MDNPYSLDFFQTITDVHFGSGTTFVYTTYAGEVHSIMFNQGGAIASRSSTKLAGPGVPSAWSSTYHLIDNGPDVPAEPVFLVSGTFVSQSFVDDGAGNTIMVLNFSSCIFKSNDGVRWRNVHTQTGVGARLPEDQIIYSAGPLVWDDGSQAFYLAQSHGEGGIATPETLSSSNGDGWGVAASGSGTFAPHCSGNECVDENGQHVADGVMAHDTSDKRVPLIAQPDQPPIVDYDGVTFSWQFSSDGETYGDAQVFVTTTGDTKQFNGLVSMPAMQKVFGVAGYGGIFLAGGSSDAEGLAPAAALSVDKGNSWVPFGTSAGGPNDPGDSNCITSVTAAPSGDISRFKNAQR